MKIARINESVDKFNIGIEFVVNDETENSFNISPTWTIRKDCCTVLSDDTQQDTVSKEAESKGWCIRRTPENAEALNKWMNSMPKVIHKAFTDCGFIHSKPIDSSRVPYTSQYKIEGFTELFTVEDFFAKVGYTPELEYMEFPTFVEPKLIAKAGEWVKIVEYGIAYNIQADDHIVKLLQDLTVDTFVFEDQNGEVKGWSGNFKNIGMKLEKCPTPVESAKEEVTTERIPFDLEKWKTNKYDVISRDGRIVEILKSNLKADETIVLLYNQNDGSQHACAIKGDGKVLFYGDHDDDLFLIPKTKTVWRNVWYGEEYNSEADAKFMSGYELMDKCELMKTIQVTKAIE